MNKLISMTDYVLEQTKLYEESDDENKGKIFVARCYKYARFLKRPLELGMFVPCDEDGNVLEYPNIDHSSDDEEQAHKDAFNSTVYFKAKERVLFEGFGYFKQGVFESHFLKLNNSVPFEIDFRNSFIEDLIFYNLTLTNNALK